MLTRNEFETLDRARIDLSFLCSENDRKCTIVNNDSKQEDNYKAKIVEQVKKLNRAVDTIIHSE